MWFSLQSGDGHGPWFGNSDQAPDEEVEDLRGCGLNLFLASLSMLFGAAILGAILVRTDQASFEATIDAQRALGLGVATLLLFAAERSMARRGADVRRALRGGLAFGVLFLVAQAWNWWSLSRDGFGIDSGTLEAVLFYMLTILHALHVVGRPRRAGRRRAPRGVATRPGARAALLALLGRLVGDPAHRARRLLTRARRSFRSPRRIARLRA